LTVSYRATNFSSGRFKIPASEKHERDEIVPLDFQHPFDGVRLEFSIHIEDLFHDLCVFLRQERDRDRTVRPRTIQGRGESTISVGKLRDEI